MENIDFNGFSPKPEDTVPAEPVQMEPEPVIAQNVEQEQPTYVAPEPPVQPVCQQPASPVQQTVPQQPAQVSYGYTAPKPPHAPKEKPKGKGFKVVLALILALVIAAGSSFLTVFIMQADANRRLEEQIQLAQQALENRIDVQMENSKPQGGQQSSIQVPATEGMTPAQVYEMNVNAVVAVASEGVSTNIYGQISRTASSGSGFIISADGYVVSNYHVVKGGETLTVIMSDGTEHEAELIGYDETNDVSLMKIEGKDLPFTTFGSSDALVVGDQVCAIGNPLGELTSTLTVGYVSAMERQVTTENGAMNMIQTDAAINSGNSGGPLFNAKGEVIGITTAKFSGTSNSGATIEGIGFAIPIDDVKEILSDLQEFGYVTSAYLGVEVRDVDSSGVSYGLPEGAFVQSVVEGGGADKAGIRPQDIIVDFAGHKIESVNDLLIALRKVEIGKETTVTVYRAGQQVILNVIPEEKPQENS